MSISKRGVEKGRSFKSMGRHNEFLSRITKTLYYGRLPTTERLSLPVSELASDLFSEVQQGHSLNLLYCEDVAAISRNACVSPCSFVLALLYLERLKRCNADYLRYVAPSKLFLIALMVSSKYLHDDGEEDEVFTDEWARSGEITVSELCQLEKEFLNAIDWNLYVYESTFWNRLEKLEGEIALREGTKRGWFTYTEFNVIVLTHEVLNLVNTLVTLSAVLAATYAAGVFTLAGSVYVTSRLPGTSLYLHMPKDLTSDMTLPTSKTIHENDSLALNVSIPDKLETVDTVKYNNTYKNIQSTVSVLNTSFILVSILACNENSLICDKTNDRQDSEKSTWDWWNNSLMTWLSDISKLNEYETVTLPQNYYKNFAHDKLVDMSIASHKILHLEDKIHKATKVRLQEQMERSWHEEWTDTIITTIGFLNPISVY